ncbi:CAP domain-containing protein [Roseateles paludis]|uniref:CAP domain-containing protein n=1 Tax=Roseateles paludis TaxID=3145238 RepID=A0ABV0FY60_9BURK
MTPSRALRSCLVSLCAGSLLLTPAWACHPAPEVTQAALNGLRKQAQRCGDHAVAAVGALQFNPLLEASALRYAQELSSRDRIDHVGAASSSLRARLRESGYAMRVAGENLAGGPETLDEALAGWIASPVHCENLMWPAFTEFGLACVRGAGKYQRYWVLHLAQPTHPGVSVAPIRMAMVPVP